MTRHAPLRCATALLLLACAPLPAQTASAKRPVAPPVLVDTVVTDQANAPLHGLAASDFHIFDDGKEQAITTLQPHASPAAEGIPRQQFVVLLFGPQSPESQPWVKQAAAKFIAANAGPDRLLTVSFTDVCYNTRTTRFTTDASQLQRALDNWPDLLHCEHPANAGGDLRALYYAQLAQDLAPLPGHKTVALFLATAGPAVEPAASKPPESAPASRRSRARNDHTPEPHWDPFDMEHEFRKANASVYPIEVQPDAAMPAWATSLAAASGGRTLTRMKDDAGALDPLTRDLDESYTLVFTPRLSAEGSCHELKVTVNRPDAKVLGRNLYCNVPTAVTTTAAVTGPSANNLESLAATAGNMEATASLPYFYEADGTARVNLALEIPSPVLEATDRDGKLHAEIEMLGMAYLSTGEVTARFTHKEQFDFDTRQQLEEFQKHPLHCEHQFELAPGNYQFKVVFRSSKERFGAVDTTLSIDPLHPAQLSLSAIALSRDPQPISAEAVQDAAESGTVPLIFRGNRVTVSGSDLLPKAGTSEAYFEIYEPPAAGAAARQVSMRLSLVDAESHKERWNSGNVDLSALAKSGDRVIPVALRLPVATLPAGTYRAELIVQDSAGGVAARAITFRTE